MQKKENNQTQAAIEFQSIVRNNVRMILARFPQKQESFASALQMSQASISKKLNGKADWTSADIANAAVYFGLPFYVLVSPTALKDYLFTDPEAEYQLPHYAAVDISRREKGETSWREASCFDSGDVKHEAERKNRVDGGGRSGVVQGAGGGSCERFRDRGDQRRLGISTEPKWFS